MGFEDFSDARVRNSHFKDLSKTPVGSNRYIEFCDQSYHGNILSESPSVKQKPKNDDVMLDVLDTATGQELAEGATVLSHVEFEDCEPIDAQGLIGSSRKVPVPPKFIDYSQAVAKSIQRIKDKVGDNPNLYILSRSTGIQNQIIQGKVDRARMLKNRYEESRPQLAGNYLDGGNKADGEYLVTSPGHKNETLTSEKSLMFDPARGAGADRPHTSISTYFRKRPNRPKVNFMSKKMMRDDQRALEEIDLIKNTFARHGLNQSTQS